MKTPSSDRRRGKNMVHTGRGFTVGGFKARR